VVLAPVAEVIVLPAVGWVHRGRLRRHLRGADPRAERLRQRTWRHEAAREEFHSLRPFRPGDSPRWIHWRTSARRGELMVREFEDVPGQNLVLVFALTPAPSGQARGLEQAIGLAASIAWEWCRQRGDRLALAVADPRPRLLDGLTGPDHARAVLSCLALLGPGRLGDPSGLVCLLEGAALPKGPVLVVGAGPTPLADLLRRTLARPVTAVDALDKLDFYRPALV
jgi:uncharacterized protein (DUF58 family)